MTIHSHQCSRIIGDDRRGLWCGHEGDHALHEVGGYLSSPLLTPLDVLRLKLYWRSPCPLCGSQVNWTDEVEHLAVRRWDGDGWSEPQVESEWRFHPCGCEGREVH